MSTETVRQFLKKAESTPELQSKLQSVPKGGGQATIAQIVSLGAASGFTFSDEDYENTIDEVLSEKHAAGALNDSELALINGGLMCTSTQSTKCTCCKKSTVAPKSGTSATLG